MMLDTVCVSLRGLFQTAEPFDGILRVKLSRPAICKETGICVLPEEWQEIPFESDGEACANLIPNSVTGEGTYYCYEIICNLNTGAYVYDKYGKRKCIQKGAIVVPDHDCNFADIAILEPVKEEPIEASKAYASEAKQCADKVSGLVADAERAAEESKSYSELANQIKDECREIAKEADYSASESKASAEEAKQSEDLARQHAEQAQIDLTAEATARKNADDAEATARKDGDYDTLAAAKAYTDGAVGSIDLSPYAKKSELSEETARAKSAEEANALAAANAQAKADANAESIEEEADARAQGDEQTLSAAKEYADTAVGSIDLTPYARKDADQTLTGKNTFDGNVVLHTVIAGEKSKQGDTVFDSVKIVKSDGSVGAMIDFGDANSGKGGIIRGLKNPQNIYDATSKYYVDSAISNLANNKASKQELADAVAGLQEKYKLTTIELDETNTAALLDYAINTVDSTGKDACVFTFPNTGTDVASDFIVRYVCGVAPTFPEWATFETDASLEAFADWVFVVGKTYLLTFTEVAVGRYFASIKEVQ